MTVNDEIVQLQKKLSQLGRSIRADLESKIYVETKTILVDGVEYTVPVTICPTTHGTGLAEQVLYDRAVFSADKKLIQKSKLNNALK